MPLPIYICDDQPEHLQFISTCVQDVIRHNLFQMNIAFSSLSPIELKEHLQKNPPSQTGIYFLDVDLKNPIYNGFTLGQAIREIDPKGHLIFVTTHEELAIETFRYRLEAMDYILKEKPALFMPRIYQCLTTVQEREQQMDSSTESVFTLKVFDEIIKLPFREILYFETSSYSHKVVVYSIKKTIEFYGQLQDIADFLPSNFMRTHRSFIVNLDFVEVLHQKENELELINRARCLISRTMKKEFQKYLLQR